MFPVELTLRIYHDFVQGQGNPTSCQRFAEMWMLQIFDMRMDVPVPVQSRG